MIYYRLDYIKSRMTKFGVNIFFYTLPYGTA